MTAEVAVMNQLGVALAADSAVTITKRDNPDKTDKIFHSQDKLFQLVENAPVAVMTYGDAKFLGMPWEVIFKAYRDARASKTFPKLADYANDFFHFVESNADMFLHGEQQTRMENALAQSSEEAFEALVPHINTVIKDHDLQLDNPKHKKAIGESIHAEVKGIRANIKRDGKKLDGFDAAFKRDFLAQYGELVASKREKILGVYPLPAKTKKEFNMMMMDLLCVEDDEESTGIVFAGFGEEEYMPSVFSYHVAGMIAGNLRFWFEGQKLSWESHGWIGTFAQNEVMNAFLDGVSEDYIEAAERDIIDPMLNKIYIKFQDIVSDIPPPKLEQFRKFLSDRWDEASEKLWKNRDAWIPIHQMVASMPKDELASTAETLVNLTKFRLRVNNEQESVGGPIDVAVITKGDGFVWVKRKDYFPAKLNPDKKIL